MKVTFSVQSGEPMGYTAPYMSNEDLRETVHAVVGALGLAVAGYLGTWLLFSQ